MAACVCIYLLNAALHHAGATAQDECFAGLNGFKSSGTSNPGACSACCFDDKGNMSHCCGLRNRAVKNCFSGACEDEFTCSNFETPVLCIEPCTDEIDPDECRRQSAGLEDNTCCPFEGEFTDPDFQEEHV